MNSESGDCMLLVGVWLTRMHSHKRFDPAYNDAKTKAGLIGDFNFYSSYMSQPKSQLETFRAWAGIDSDISYYLNSHHVGCLACS